MKTDTAKPRLTPRERWERIGLGIRLAYNADAPHAIRCWLGLGRLLAERGELRELDLQRRLLRLLLQTANDAALPARWRQACLEHTVRPLARLRSLLALHDPLAWAALEQDWEAAQALALEGYRDAG